MSYTACDASGARTSAEVTLVVDAVNDPPTIPDQDLTADGPITITVTGDDVDGDPLTYQITTLPEHGAVTTNRPTFTFTPDDGFPGTDTFVVSVCDAGDTCAQATVRIRVTAGSGSGPGLPDTGGSPAAPWAALAGAVLILLGGFVLRRRHG